MQQVFNPLLLYFELVHFYNNAEKKRKSFRGKTPAFFWAFFSRRRDCFSTTEKNLNQFFAEQKRAVLLFGSRRAATTYS